jgi:hypothetical protein
MQIFGAPRSELEAPVAQQVKQACGSARRQIRIRSISGPLEAPVRESAGEAACPSPLRRIGLEMSPGSLEVRSDLRYEQIPFESIDRSRRRCRIPTPILERLQAERRIPGCKGQAHTTLRSGHFTQEEEQGPCSR